MNTKENCSTEILFKRRFDNTLCWWAYLYLLIVFSVQYPNGLGMVETGLQEGLMFRDSFKKQTLKDKPCESSTVHAVMPNRSYNPQSKSKCLSVKPSMVPSKRQIEQGMKGVLTGLNM